MIEPAVPEAVLRDRVVAGDREALAELYRRFSERVFQTAWRLSRSRADAEDVLQDVFLGLTEALRSFTGSGSLEAWLRRVAARTTLMRLRSASRRRESALPEDLPRATRAEDLGSRLALERAIAALPDALRAVFVLREIEGYTHAEIAAMLGIAVNASEVRLHRARAALRRALKEDR